MKVLKSEELRGKYHCRLMKNLKKEIEVTTKKNDNYDNAIIIKQIIMGYLKGEFQINEFHDLVSEGVEENNLPVETNEGRIKRLTEILTRYASCEKRKLEVEVDAKDIPVSQDYAIHIRPDAVSVNKNEIEAIILDNAEEIPVLTGGKVGNRLYCKTAVSDYVKHVVSTTDVRFDGLSIALDCANGSASVCAKEIFTSLGAKCLMLSDTPDGTNINDNCGSTHPEELMRFVKDASLDLGLAFDGDADRMLAVDENGKLVDGDKVIAICSKKMKDEGTLAKNTAVVTVMSNMGFFKFCEENDIACAKTAVGDRYVLERMLKEGYNIGGEQSGHVIFLDYATTGDGELSGVQLIEAVVKSGKKLSELAKIMKVYPQVLINVKVTPEGKQKYNNDEYIISAVQQAEMELMGEGRVLVRVSGTEPLIRVMLEGSDLEQITTLGNKIADVVRNRLS